MRIARPLPTATAASLPFQERAAILSKTGKTRPPHSGHRPADLFQDQEHGAVPRPEPGEVGREAPVESWEAPVPGGLHEAVEDARIEGGVC